jgi:hypothetical protein
MTKPIKAQEQGLQPHYKVRVVIPGAVLHLAARTEPEVKVDGYGALQHVKADWYVNDPGYGDTAGYIDWTAVRAVTWRWSE